MWLKYFIVAFCAAVTATDAGMDITCNKGQYVGFVKRERQACLPCEEGKFMPLDYHRKRSCIHCSKPRTRSHEITLESCTPTDDTVIGCTKGYLRENRIRLGVKEYGKCLRDTRNQRFCRKGEFMNDTLKMCLPCPEGTFISMDNHTFRSCAPCTIADRISNEILRRECTKTSDAVVGCSAGYYRENRYIYGMKTHGKCKRDMSEGVSCSKGEYLSKMKDKQTTCLPCPDETYISEDNHTNTECLPCKTAVDISSDEVIRENCTPTSDAVIDCKEGYVRVNRMRNTYEHCEKFPTKPLCGRGEYRKKADERCLPCPPGKYQSKYRHNDTDCARCTKADGLHEIILENCTSTSDTVVGCDMGYHRVDRLTVDIKTYSECDIMPDRTTCGKGEYLSTVKATGGTICLTCPRGTFISEDNHSYTDCAPCSEAEEYLHEMVLRPCTAISDAVIGCKNGYFRSVITYLEMKEYGECEKCSPCDHFTITPCGMFTDTVCCSQPKAKMIQADNDDRKHPNEINNPPLLVAVCDPSE